MPTSLCLGLSSIGEGSEKLDGLCNDGLESGAIWYNSICAFNSSPMIDRESHKRAFGVFGGCDDNAVAAYDILQGTAEDEPVYSVPS
jgi:hypothetical protein